MKFLNFIVINFLYPANPLSSVITEIRELETIYKLYRSCVKEDVKGVEEILREVGAIEGDETVKQVTEVEYERCEEKSEGVIPQNSSELPQDFFTLLRVPFQPWRVVPDKTYVRIDKDHTGIFIDFYWVLQCQKTSEALRTPHVTIEKKEIIRTLEVHVRYFAELET